MKTLILFFIIGFLVALTFQCTAIAAIDGPCVNCHTMHNRQDGTSMNFDGSGTPKELLLRADCLGCHGQDTDSNILGPDRIPQVLHTNSVDLAGGNFNYILGGKGSGASDAKGHNVIDLGNNDDVLTKPPGAQHADLVSNTELTCAGTNGCHGRRNFAATTTAMRAIKGGHHNNLEGKVDSLYTDRNVGHQYRFLMGIKGFEDSDWQATVNANDHNEYFGVTTPMNIDGCLECHDGGGGEVIATSQTISGFCATCHGNFHSLGPTFLGDPGIGGNTSSPFVRHPTDVILPNRGEYASYTNYSPEAPIARTIVPGSSNNLVQPGTDVVMCLSCHAAHGTSYPDILRWDYSDMVAGDPSASGGCLTCHTQKNQ